MIPVGKLAIQQFLPPAPLQDVIGRPFRITYRGHATDCIPLPHPSGASPWHPDGARDHPPAPRDGIDRRPCRHADAGGLTLF